MKKLYIIPTASFEPLEDENLMIGTSKTNLLDKTTPGSVISQNEPSLGGDLGGIDTGNTGGIFVDDGEGDD